MKPLSFEHYSSLSSPKDTPSEKSPPFVVNGDDNILGIRFIKNLQRGDLVTLKSSRKWGVQVFKRIIAFEGDYVFIKNHYFQIPPGHCWVEGDNAFISQDSSRYGPIPLALITSIPTFIYWPFDRIGIINKNQGNPPKKLNPSNPQHQSIFESIVGISKKLLFPFPSAITCHDTLVWYNGYHESRKKAYPDSFNSFGLI